MPRPIRVLSVDGGGIRGLLPAMLLAELERRAKRPARDLFDLIAGTSTGGIIAAGVASGLDAADLAQFYPKYGHRIFGGAEQSELSRRLLGTGATWKERLLGPAERIGAPFGRPDDLGGNARHQAIGLEEVLREVLGDRTLASALVPLAITAYDAEHGQPIVFSTADALSDPDRDLPLRLVARATSAAPTYFPPLEVEWAGSKRRFVDGGVWANNPAVVAASEIVRHLPTPTLPSDLLVVSLGTGVGRPSATFSQEDPWVAAASTLLGMAIGVDGPDLVMQRALGSGYRRFQVVDDAVAGAMDDPSTERLDGLTAAAHRLIAERAADLDAVVGALTG